MSDIHIRRNGSRYPEYRDVFRRVYAFLLNEVTNKKNAETSLIIITGDILYSKLLGDIPMNVFLAEFFTELIKYYPLIIIPGNHDGHLTSSESYLDTSFAYLKNSGRFFYLNQTGIYQYQNIFFGVTSVFNNNLPFLSAKYITNDILKEGKQFKKLFRIALFHGQVYGNDQNDSQDQQLDDDFNDDCEDDDIDNNEEENDKLFSNRKLTVKKFKGYELILLGDAHTRKFLDPNKKNIAQAGSLIQQSCRENVDGHGILVWNLNKGTVKPKDIHNDYAYVKCLVEGDTIKIEPQFLRPKTVVNFVFKNCDDDQMNFVIQKYIGNPKLLRYSVKNVHEFVKNISSLYNVYKSSSFPLTTLRNQKKLIELVSLLNNDQDLTRNILDYHSQLYKKIPEPFDHDSSSRYRWEIMEMEFSNIFCYGESNVINFTKFQKNEIIGIFAKNHNGKSTTFIIILFTLFGKIQSSTINKVIHEGKSSCKSTIKFKIGNVVYLVHRECRRHGTDETKTSKFTLSSLDENGVPTVITSDIKSTETEIKNLVGTYEDFLKISIFSPQSTIKFKLLKPNDKKLFIMDLLGINPFGQFFTLATEESKSLNKQIKNTQTKINADEKFHELSSELMFIDSNIEGCELAQMNIDQLLPDYSDLKKYGIDKVTSVQDIQVIIDQLDSKTHHKDIMRLRNFEFDFKQMKNDNEFYASHLKYFNRDNLLLQKGALLDKLKRVKKSKNSSLDNSTELEKYDIIQEYIKIVHVGGLPTEILKIWLIILQKEVNKILSKITDFTLQFGIHLESTDSKIMKKYFKHLRRKNGFDLYLVFDNKLVCADNASGSQNFLLNFAFILAAYKLSNKPVQNFFFIDEGWDSFDEDARANLSPLMTFMKSYFDYPIIISNLDGMRSYSYATIDIISKNDVSKTANDEPDIADRWMQSVSSATKKGKKKKSSSILII